MPLPDFLMGLSLPVIASPMFIASGPDLVIAQCTSGIVGSFPALNARPSELLDEWIDAIEEGRSSYQSAHPEAFVAPFAVNQIVHRTNARLESDLETIVRRRVPIVITSLGARPDVNAAIHSYGGLVLHDVISDEFARKAIDKGADGIIAIAAGAGGHTGTLSPFALLREIRSWFNGPLILSGAIAEGASILAAQVMGADLAYIGSAFLSTDEANITDDYRQMILESRASDIVMSDAFTGINGNYLRGSIVATGLDPSRLIADERSILDLESDTVIPAKAWKDIWGAGQGIGSVSTPGSASQLIERMKAEYRAALSSAPMSRRGDDSNF